MSESSNSSFKSEESYNDVSYNEDGSFEINFIKALKMKIDRKESTRSLFKTDRSQSSSFSKDLSS